MNTFVSVDAVVTKRTQVFNRLDQLFLTCNACGAINGPYNEGTAGGHSGGNFWPENLNCMECNSKSFVVCAEKTKYKNYQKVTVQEPPGTVLAGRMPRSKECILTGELVDSIKP